MDIIIDISAKGPVFDGAIPAIMAMYEYNVTQTLGNMAVNMIRDHLPTVYKYPRDPASLHGTKHFVPGLYVSDIHTDRASVDLNLVHDTPVVYGPWLEGVGSQNATTRFKGYHTFRLISQELNARAAQIAETQIQPYITMMNA